MLYTTLNKIRAHHPCESGWRKLLKSLGKTKPDDARLSLLTIYKSNGLDDALWCLRAVDNVDFFARRFALDCARAVEHLNPDPRVKACNDTVERFLKNKATENELAAGAAAEAAGAAAEAAARDAARVAAWDAAWAAIVKHFIACLNAWPKGKWPKMKPLKVK